MPDITMSIGYQWFRIPMPEITMAELTMETSDRQLPVVQTNPTRQLLSLGVLRKWASFFISLLISLLGIYMHPDLSSVPRSADVAASSEWRPKPRWPRGSPQTYALCKGPD